MPAVPIINQPYLYDVIAVLSLLAPLLSLRPRRPQDIFTKKAKTAAMPSI